MRKLTRMTQIMALSAVIALLLIGSAGAIPWMYQPTNQHGSLGNNYLEFQNYGGSPYYHDGIDVMQATGGVHVYSVSDGWMTHETAGTMYGGIMIGDQYAAGAPGWLYWHLPNSTYPFNVGDRIYTGDYIGDIAYWSVYNFNHTHFNKVVGTGGLPWSWYTSTDNPLEWLVPNSEAQPPTIYNAVGTNLLAFCINNTSSYLSPTSLRGDVDIIAKIGDKIWNDRWECIPYRLEYTIAGGSISDHRLAFVFKGWFPGDNTVPIVYKDDATCNTEGNYTARQYYFILTNNDGDSTIESTDNAGTWHTAGYPSGQYAITVQAWDKGGNLTQATTNVSVSSPAYNVAITLTPTSSLQLPASGGTITYTLNIQNNQGSKINCDVWLEMTYPAGNVATVLQKTIMMPAGGTITRNLSQTIAGSEPNGTYSFYGKVGGYPYNVWDSDGFNFTKGLSGASIGPWAEQTELSGWDQEPAASFPLVSAPPHEFGLVEAHPNPFNPVTTISYVLPGASFLNLIVYDLSGREVAQLAHGWKEAGSYQAVFDASNLPSGIYLYHLSAGNYDAGGKMVLVK